MAEGKGFTVTLGQLDPNDLIEIGREPLGLPDLPGHPRRDPVLAGCWRGH